MESVRNVPALPSFAGGECDDSLYRKMVKIGLLGLQRGEPFPTGPVSKRLRGKGRAGTEISVVVNLDCVAGSPLPPSITIFERGQGENVLTYVRVEAAQGGTARLRASLAGGRIENGYLPRDLSGRLRRESEELVQRAEEALIPLPGRRHRATLTP